MGEATKKGLHDAVDAGSSIISNCNFDFMVGVSPRKDGRVNIHVKEATVIMGSAEAEFVRKVVTSWMAALAVYDARWRTEPTK